MKEKLSPLPFGYKVKTYGFKKGYSYYHKVLKKNPAIPEVLSIERFWRTSQVMIGLQPVHLLVSVERHHQSLESPVYIEEKQFKHDLETLIHSKQKI